MNAMSQDWSPQGTPNYSPAPSPGYGSTPPPSYGSTPSPVVSPAAPTVSGQPSQAGFRVSPAPGNTWGPTAPRPTVRREPKDDNPFAALLDFEFRRYATPGLIKVVYIVLLAAIVLSMLVGLVSGLGMLSSRWTVEIGLLTVFGSVVGAAVAVLLVRVGLEYAIATIRMSSDIAKMRDELRSYGPSAAAGQP